MWFNTNAMLLWAESVLNKLAHEYQPVTKKQSSIEQNAILTACIGFPDVLFSTGLSFFLGPLSFNSASCWTGRKMSFFWLHASFSSCFSDINSKKSKMGKKVHNSVNTWHSFASATYMLNLERKRITFNIILLVIVKLWLDNYWPVISQLRTVCSHCRLLVGPQSRFMHTTSSLVTWVCASEW